MSAIRYDDDFYGWTQQQSHIIRAVPSICQELPRGLDIDNLAEEIEDLGRSQLSSVESHARNALAHIIKAVSDPECPAVNHWKRETRNFLLDLRSRFSPSMKQKLDLQIVWEDALDLASDGLLIHGRELMSGLPTACPFGIGDLLSREFTFDSACNILNEQTARPGI